MQISKIDVNSGCQPLKQSISAVPLRDNVAFKNSGLYSSIEYNKLNDKYDVACEVAATNLKIAAVWKQKYESLKSEKSCCI